MKKIIIALLTLISVFSGAEAVSIKGLKIYINPGHGGYDSDDRNIIIYPFQQGDTLGYWESKSNLYKGLHMYYILDSLGAKPYLSRIKNRTEDDRSLSGISQEANSLGCDLFFSIHSNAGENVNYPLMLYRENAVGTPRYPEAINLSNILWDNLHSSKLSLWTRDTRYVSGDLTFYPQWGTSGLGVLRNLYVVGLLSEGGMHEHRPEAHRLMNDDFCWLEAWHFVKSIMDYYNTDEKFVTGNVAGVVYDDHNTREKTLDLQYTVFGRDKNKPLNGAYIELRDANGGVVQKRTTDNMNNGVFVFRNVKPGSYKLVSNCDGYYESAQDVAVVANEVTYNDIPLSLKRQSQLVVEEYGPNVQEGDLVSCAESLSFKFNFDIDEKTFEKALIVEPSIAGEFSYKNSYHEAYFKPKTAFDLNTKYTITLSTDLATPDKQYSNSHLQSPLSFSFTTKGRNKLEMIESFPQENGEVHYKSPTLEFRFDKKIDAKNIYSLVKVYDKDGKELVINSRSSSYNKLTGEYGNLIIVLNSNLNIGEKYKVVLSPEIKDMEGIPLTNEVSINFTGTNQGEDKGGEVLEDFENPDKFVYDVDESKQLVDVPTLYSSTSKYLFGNNSYGIAYNFSDTKGGYLMLNYTGDLKIVNKGDKLGLYVYGDLNNHDLYLGFRAGTDTKMEKVAHVDFLGWRYFQFTPNDLEENVEYLFQNIKIVQSEGLYTQKGAILLDNFIRTDKSGISNTINDNKCVYYDAASKMVKSTIEDPNSIFTLYNTQGMILKNIRDVEMNMSDIIPGIYYVKVENNSINEIISIIIR